jgi:hypothetical protein
VPGSSYVTQAEDESGVTNKAVGDRMVIDHEGSRYTIRRGAVGHA